MGENYWEPEEVKKAYRETAGLPAITPSGMEIGTPVGAATENRLRENAVMGQNGFGRPLILPPDAKYVPSQNVTIAPGAVVQLKSGGPLMTVASIHEDSQLAECQWWDGSSFREAMLPVVSLAAFPGTPPAVDIANKVLRANKLA